MSIDLEKLNSDILDEANEILYKLGLYDALKKYGNPQVSGSYSLKLMTWRDLDIYLETDTSNNDNFFELGKEISIKLKPTKMSFRNELIGKTPHLPNGLFWGVHTNLFGHQWKIDIWAIGSEEVKKKQNDVEEIKIQLDDIKRKSILELKKQLHSHPKYRKAFFSVDIYQSVINDNIESLSQFEEWLSRKSGIKL
ncbi:hypothetical protein ACQKMI_24840 [Lysinibacillus sp. NPDC097214]|uniref:hypothetical protein n=1 Tax=Lysinibacillus sp. NPDC097214 TaxID=3390584 RepID=UPI003D0640F8